MLATYYLAGPMRGYEAYNFKAFFAAETELKKMGHVPINPARHDREMGFNEKQDIATQAYLRNALAWDLGQVCRSDGVVVLAGWRKSRGARAEVATARALDLPIYIMVRKQGHIELREATHVAL